MAALKLFICYAHEDKALKDELVAYLEPIADQHRLDVWDDSRIAPGESWLPAIESALDECHTALLLVSADFLRSRFIKGTELPKLLLRRKQDGLAVIPVILSSCLWEDTAIGKLQALPADGIPITAHATDNNERPLALTLIAKHVLQLSRIAEEANQVQVQAASAAPAALDSPAFDAASAMPLAHSPVFTHALRLDRDKPWHELIAEIKDGRSTIFLLHGELEQNLGMFLSRVLLYLAEESRVRLNKRTVWLDLGQKQPQTANGYVRRLREALQTKKTAPDAIRDAAQASALLLFVGERPFGPSPPSSEGSAQALLNFMGEHLPELLSQSTTHPVHAMLSVAYKPGEQQLYEQLQAVIGASAAQRGVNFKTLQLTTVTKAHVELFLDKFDEPLLSPQQRIDILALFEKLDRENSPFGDLAKQLSQAVLLEYDD